MTVACLTVFTSRVRIKDLPSAPSPLPLAGVGAEDTRIPHQATP